MPFESVGTMIVNTYTAGGALPVAGTVVRITGVDEDNRGIEYSVITDVDGVSEKISLPAPPRALSQIPGAREQPYAQYNVDISAPGYYSKRIFNVAVFDGAETLQRVNMIPLPDNRAGITYPRDNLRVTVKENEMLE